MQMTVSWNTNHEVIHHFLDFEDKKVFYSDLNQRIAEGWAGRQRGCGPPPVGLTSQFLHKAGDVAIEDE